MLCTPVRYVHKQPEDVRKANFERYREEKKNAVKRDSKGKMMQEEWEDLKGKILGPAWWHSD